MTTHTELCADKTLPVYLFFSGGKDSVAAYLHLRELGRENVTCLFTDTGHESAITYDYIDSLRRHSGFPIITIQPLVRDMWLNDPPSHATGRDDLDEPLTMERLAVIKKRFPAPTARFCTTHLKLYPARRWLMANVAGLCVIASGVRAEESAKRAALPPYYFDELMGRYRWLPIQDWTVQQVFDCHERHGIPPNPLYKRGFSRVGCYPCIMSRKTELAAIALHDPAAFDRLTEMENKLTKETGRISTFLGSATSAKYKSLIEPKSGRRLSTADDVRRWALDAVPNHADGELNLGAEMYAYDDGEDLNAAACSSPYGLCE